MSILICIAVFEVTISDENIFDVASALLTLLEDPQKLSSPDVVYSAAILDGIVSIGEIPHKVRSG